MSPIASCLRALLPLSILAGCLPTGAPSWIPMTDRESAALTTRWEIPIDDTPAPFLVATETAFVVATQEGSLRSHPLGSTTASWRVDLASGIAGTPRVLEGVLAVPLQDSSLQLIDMATGSLGQRFLTPSIAPFVTSGAGGLLIADPAGRVTLIDVREGSVTWDVPFPEIPSAGVADCGPLLIVGGSEGSLVALDPLDGSRLWTGLLGAPVTTEAACAGAHAFIGAADNRLHALKLRRKGFRERWTYATGGDIIGRPVLLDDQVVFFSYDTYIYALADDNGHLEWKARLGRRPRPEWLLMGSRLLTAPLNTERLELFRLPGGGQEDPFTLTGGRSRFVTGPVGAGDLILIGAARYGDTASRVIALAPPSEDPTVVTPSVP